MERLLLTAVVVLSAVPVFAQGTQADYERALGLRKQYESQIGNATEAPRWIARTHKASYRRTVKGGHDFILVDADAKTKAPAFDHAAVAAALSKAIAGKSTMQVVNQLIKYNKDFDLLAMPGAGHTSGGTYGDRKRWDFFVRSLLGVTPPRWTDAMKTAATSAAAAAQVDEENELASPWVTERGGDR